jgi:hypothetical protein
MILGWTEVRVKGRRWSRDVDEVLSPKRDLRLTILLQDYHEAYEEKSARSPAE